MYHEINLLSRAESGLKLNIYIYIYWHFNHIINNIKFTSLNFYFRFLFFRNPLFVFGEMSSTAFPFEGKKKKKKNHRMETTMTEQ